MRTIELLAPARDANIGREAILHGADAVYIGGPAFGARAAATESVEEIHTLCDFAHLYGAKVYVALNTILYDHELQEAEQLVWQLYEARADALIVQDMALLRMKLPPIALHASTQTDNRTSGKALDLEKAGFSQIVLARELSLKEISAISQQVTVPLEAFVHGALCVSYSGRCYASQYCFNRSANRGECAQFCRLAFDLYDGAGRRIKQNKHLLSLRDMNRSLSLEAMMDAGISSFKIEGRLKDMSYVKNTVAYYRQRFDEIISRRPKEYCSSSFGHSAVTFTPDLERSFNRGFTDYFLHNPHEHVASHDSVASKGKYVGTVISCSRNALRLKLNEGVTIAAGDGLCYIDEQKGMLGFRANRAEGEMVYPHQPQQIKAGTAVYRNHDAVFERLLSRTTATRTMSLRLVLDEIADGFRLTGEDESGIAVEYEVRQSHEPAQKPQVEQIRKQLARLGGTPWRATEIIVNTSAFIPASTLAQWRRTLVEKLTEAHRANYQRPTRKEAATDMPAFPHSLDYSANVANEEAKAFYQAYGTVSIAPAYELQKAPGASLMTCRYCIRRELDACLKEGGGHKLAEPLSLCLPDGRKFPLSFDCKRCEMHVLPQKAPNNTLILQ